MLIRFLGLPFVWLALSGLTVARAEDAQMRSGARLIAVADTLYENGIVGAQRAGLLVDAPTEPNKVRLYTGKVQWHTESPSPGDGQPAASVVRADVDIPELDLKLSMRLQKNADPQLSASHMIELRFTTAPDGELGSVKKIGVPQLRNENAATGQALVGAPVAITTNYFLVGLAGSNAAGGNLNLLRGRGWIDIPFYFTSGKLAKVTFEKGEPGQNAIEAAIRSWR
jgi:hypothetical protein